MRNILNLLMLSLLFSCVNKKTASDTEVSFVIEGMVCEEACAKVLQKELSAKEGVNFCTVNFDTKKATLKYDSKQVQMNDIERIVKGVNDGQYEIHEVEIKEISTSDKNSMLENSSNGSSSNNGLFSIKSFESFNILQLVTNIF